MAVLERGFKKVGLHAWGSLGEGGSFSFSSRDVILAKRDFDGVGDVKPAQQTCAGRG